MGRGAYPGARADLAVWSADFGRCSNLVTHLSRRIYIRCPAVTRGGVAWSHVLSTRTSVGRVDRSSAARGAHVRCARRGRARCRRAVAWVVSRALDPLRRARRVRRWGLRARTRLRRGRCRAAAAFRAEHRLRAWCRFAPRRLPALPLAGLRARAGRPRPRRDAFRHGRAGGCLHARAAPRWRDVPAVLVLLPLLRLGAGALACGVEQLAAWAVRALSGISPRRLGG